MRAFAQLLVELDRTLAHRTKAATLESYFRETAGADAAWALWYLTGHRPKRLVKTDQLRRWVAEAVNLPLWLSLNLYLEIVL